MPLFKSRPNQGLTRKKKRVAMNWVEEMELGNESTSKRVRKRQQPSKQDKKVPVWRLKSKKNTILHK